MHHKYIDFRQMVYDLMMGYAENLSDLPVKNEFEQNSRCDAILERIYCLKLRLDTLLGTEDFPEVNQLIDSFYMMQEYLCKKMFDYGVCFERSKSLPPEIYPEEIAERLILNTCPHNEK